MKSIILATIGVLASFVQCKQVARCKSGRIPPELRVHVVDEPDSSRVAGYNKGEQCFKIDTYVHVITTERKKNNFPRSRIESQIQILNEAYNSSRFSFNLVNISRTVNDIWASDPALDIPPTPYELKYSPLLRKGSYSDLNLYVLSDLGAGYVLGYAHFPERNPNSTTRVVNGVRVTGMTLPGGEEPYDYGMTAVHEVGHWLSLFHTFGGPCEIDDTCYCDGPGDFIPDTPAAIRPYFTCGRNQTRDSCPRQPGYDTIDNYMSYGDDACLAGFTPDQIVRMLHNYAVYRWNK